MCKSLNHVSLGFRNFVAESDKVELYLIGCLSAVQTHLNSTVTPLFVVGIDSGADHLLRTSDFLE